MPQTSIGVGADHGRLATARLPNTAKSQRRTELGQFRGHGHDQGRMRGSQRSLTREGATPDLPVSRHIRTLAKFQGIKGVTGQGHVVTMDGTVWKGHAHRATTGMTNTTQVLTSLAASLAANTHHGGWMMTGYEAKTVNEIVIPILVEY